MLLRGRNHKSSDNQTQRPPPAGSSGTPGKTGAAATSVAAAAAAEAAAEAAAAADAQPGNAAGSIGSTGSIGASGGQHHNQPQQQLHVQTQPRPPSNSASLRERPATLEGDIDSYHSPQRQHNADINIESAGGPPRSPAAAGGPPALNSSQFAHPSRSQSHRYPRSPQQPTPSHNQQQQQYVLQATSASIDDIPLSAQQSQQGQQIQQSQQQQQHLPPHSQSQSQSQPQLQPPLDPPPHLEHPPPLTPTHLAGAPLHEPPKQSATRKLIKSFLGRAGHRNSKDTGRDAGTAADQKESSIGRRHSKRLPGRSPPSSSSHGPSPPSQLSHVSLDNPEWQAGPSGAEYTSTSDPRFSVDLSIQNHSQTLIHDQHSTLRSVPGDQDSKAIHHYQEDQYRYSQLLQQPQTPQPYSLSRQHQHQSDATDQPSQHQSGQYQAQQQPPPAIQPQFASQLSTTQLLRNPETVSQLSYESLATDTDQRSANHSAQTSPATAYPQQNLSKQSQGIQQDSPQAQTQHTMPAAQGGGRRPDMEDAMHAQGQDNISHGGPSPAFRPQHNRPSQATMNPLPPPPSSSSSVGAPPAANFQRYQDDQQQGQPPPANPAPPGQAQSRSGAGEFGRNSPQPDKEMKELVTKYKHVKRLYFEGKAAIDQLNSQVEQLQNAIANQRMAQSRTMLDDGEYIKLFDRLNGAMNNLAFNIRKDWRSLPQWIERYVSPDALKTGKQEMTAAGRAVTACWVMDEIFNKCFHPALDHNLSCSLKEIELNIRRNTYTINMQEEHNALTAKIVSWRMATLDGLDKLNSPNAGDHFSAFTDMVTTNLTGYLFQYLTEPPPPGIEGNVSMIVDLAVKIASNVPMESRDVAIMYPMPESHINKELMEVEKSPLPALPSDGDDPASMLKDAKNNKQGRTKLGPPPRDPNRVRFAGFLAVEVRGKQPLVKAPVWTLG